MADVSLKRNREESHSQMVQDDEEASKKIKSYNYVVSLLEEDDDEPNQDLTSLITSLKHELSYEAGFVPSTSSSTADAGKTDESSVDAIHISKEEDKESVIRHLLDASDDELGIPHRSANDYGEEEDNVIKAEDLIFSSDLLWEMEDEAANYCTLLQSELFM